LGDALESVQERGTAKGSAGPPPTLALPGLAASHVITHKRQEPPASIVVDWLVFLEPGKQAALLFSGWKVSLVLLTIHKESAHALLSLHLNREGIRLERPTSLRYRGVRCLGFLSLVAGSPSEFTPDRNHDETSAGPRTCNGLCWSPFLPDPMLCH